MKIQRKITFFDVETTGTDPAKDRIISLAYHAMFSETEHEAGKFRFNPGFQMSEEVIAVHGITNEELKDCPPFREHCSQLSEIFADGDLAGYNIRNFDIPILWEEFHRAGFTWDLSGVHVFDACAIFKAKEERSLEAAMKFYCAREHSDAHDAEGDVAATIDVLQAQIERYPDLKAMSPEQLHTFCQGDERRVDLAGKIVLSKDGYPTYAIGKAKGTLVADDPGFGRWMLKQDFFTEETKRHLRRMLGA